MANCIELRARTDPDVRVWLNFEEVTRRAFYACVPATPGEVGRGEVGMYTQWPPVRNLSEPADSDDAVLKEYKLGDVYWVPKA